MLENSDGSLLACLGFSHVLESVEFARENVPCLGCHPPLLLCEPMRNHFNTSMSRFSCRSSIETQQHKQQLDTAERRHPPQSRALE